MRNVPFILKGCLLLHLKPSQLLGSLVCTQPSSHPRTPGTSSCSAPPRPPMAVLPLPQGSHPWPGLRALPAARPLGPQRRTVRSHCERALMT